MTQVTDTVRETMRAYEMVRPGERILVGFSGGADSLCLLTVLQQLSAEMDFSLQALHVHHGIRGESADRDAAFTESFCRERAIPYRCVRVDVPGRVKRTGESVEEAARVLRYEALFKEAEACGASKIALAHHQNDSAETVLFHMIRGSGLRGLAGIPPVRGNIIRPLIAVSRSDITAALVCGNLSWRTDETNDSDEASRNRIRHNVLPALTDIRQDAAEKIAETGAYLSEVDRYLTEEAEGLLEGSSSLQKAEDRSEEGKAPLGETRSSDGTGIPAALLASSKSILREYLVSTYLRKHGFPMKDVRREHLQETAALAEKPVGKMVTLPGGVRAVRTRECVAFMYADSASGIGRTFQGNTGTFAEDQKPCSASGGQIPVSDGTFLSREAASGDPLAAYRMEIRTFPRPKDVNFPEKEYTKWFDYDKIKGVPHLRTRQPHDRIAVAPSMHRKLKDWMINEKIPREERDSVPLVCDGSDVLWAVGFRMSADYKVTPETARIMEITIITEGEENV